MARPIRQKVKHARPGAHVVRPFIGPPERPRPKTTDEILAKAGMGVAGDPLRDPLFLSARQADLRDYVRSKWREWNDGDPFSDYVYIVAEGRNWIAHQLWEAMQRRAYDLLRVGADIREVAAATYLNLEEVQAVKTEFNL